MEVIIWDNGSTDGAQTEFSQIFKEMEEGGWSRLKIIHSKENLGV